VSKQVPLGQQLNATKGAPVYRPVLVDQSGETCRAFRALHRRLPFAELDPLYAMPRSFIDAIKAELSIWLSDEETAREHGRSSRARDSR
jgi:hypothetical protein